MPCIRTRVFRLSEECSFNVTGGTGPATVTSGPFPVDCNDTLHIWSLGGIGVTVTPGSARIQIEPQNVQSTFALPGPPLAAPADPTRGAVALHSDGVWMWDTTGAAWVLAAAIGATTFLSLVDTPVNYVGAAGQIVAVNPAETGLEFVAPIDTNIYSNDGVLTSDRVLTGANFNLTFTGLNNFAVTGAGNFAVNMPTVDIVSGNIMIDSPMLSLNQFPNTRDDTGVVTPINFLYTDVTGELLSAPLTSLNIPSNILDLSDTPAIYGTTGQYLAMNLAGTALEWVTPAMGVNSFIALSDTPANYVGAAGLVPIVNAAENALEFIDPATFDTSIYANDGVLVSDRTVTGAGFNMNFTGVNAYTVDSVDFSATATDTWSIVSTNNASLVSTTADILLGAGGVIENAGEVLLANYPNTRDDVDPIINILYTDALGNLRSSAIADLNIPSSVLDLSDTPVAYGITGQVLALDATGTALEWVTPSGGATTFTALTDTPASYVGQAGFIPQVNVGETALQFVDPATFDTNTNIYNTDGVITGLRTVNGGANIVHWDNFNSFNVGRQNSDVDQIFLRAGDLAADINSGQISISATTPNSVRLVINSSFNVDAGGASAGPADIILADAATGNLLFSQYLNTRDDSAATTPSNFLYTDAAGNLLSAPVGALPASNIYNTNGALSADRIVTGFGFDLTFIGMDNITVSPTDFVVNTTGNVQFTDFLSTRDDGLSTNYLFTDALGNLQSGDIANLNIPANILDLSDTPAAYGAVGQVLALDATGTALEWVTVGAGAGTFIGLTDTPVSYAGQAGNSVRVNAAENALEYYTPADVSIYTDDGLLTAARTVDTNGFLLNFTGTGPVTINPNNDILLSAPQVFLQSGAVTARVHFIDGYFFDGGNIRANQYPTTRDDTGTLVPSNFLYTGAGGELYSAPVSALPITTLYTGDGSITGVRTVDGGGTPLGGATLNFNNFEDINLQSRNDINLTTSEGDIFASADRVASIRSVGGANLQFINLLDAGVINIGWSGFSFQLQNTGDFAISSYPETRDDTATATPINFLYMDGIGVNSRLRMSPLSQLIDTSVGVPATTPVVNGSITYDPAAGTIYGWDGVAWQTLGGSSANTLYTADDALTGNRRVDGATNSLDFDNLSFFRVGQNADVDDVFLAAGDPFGIGSGGYLQLSVTAASVLRAENTVQLVTDTDTYTFGTGQAIWTAYPDSRDDSTLTPPTNFLYTGAAGEIYSAPITALPDVSIYTNDGTLTANRTLNGNNLALNFDDLFIHNIQFNQSFLAQTTNPNSLISIQNPNSGLQINNLNPSLFTDATRGVLITAGNEGIIVSQPQLIFTSYPQTRNDTAADNPVNFLYTNSNFVGQGELRSAPLSAIIGRGVAAPVASPNTANSLFYDTAAAVLYGWNGAAWIALGGAAAPVNLYNTSDTLTANRVASGGGFNLTWDGMNNITWSNIAGDLIYADKPDGTNDSATFAPNSFYYPGATGEILVSPQDEWIARIAGASLGPGTTPAADNALTYDSVAGAIYGWDGVNHVPLKQLAPDVVVGQDVTAGDTIGTVDILYQTTNQDVISEINALLPNGGWVHFREGTYDLLDGVLNANIKLTGAGRATTIVNTNIIMVGDAAVEDMRIRFSQISFEDYANVLINNIIANAGVADYLFYFDFAQSAASHVNISNVNVSGGTALVQFSADLQADQFIIENIFMQGLRQAMIDVPDAAEFKSIAVKNITINAAPNQPAHIIEFGGLITYTDMVFSDISYRGDANLFVFGNNGGAGTWSNITVKDSRFETLTIATAFPTVFVTLDNGLEDWTVDNCIFTQVENIWNFVDLDNNVTNVKFNNNSILTLGQNTLVSGYIFDNVQQAPNGTFRDICVTDSRWFATAQNSGVINELNGQSGAAIVESVFVERNSGTHNLEAVSVSGTAHVHNNEFEATLNLTLIDAMIEANILYASGNVINSLSNSCMAMSEGVVTNNRFTGYGESAVNIGTSGSGGIAPGNGAVVSNNHFLGGVNTGVGTDSDILILTDNVVVRDNFFVGPLTNVYDGGGGGRLTFMYNLVGGKAVASPAPTPVYSEAAPAVYPGTNY